MAHLPQSYILPLFLHHAETSYRFTISGVRSSFFLMVTHLSLISRRWLGSKKPLKQVSSRWTEQITKRVFGWGWKFFFFVLINRAHASLVFLSSQNLDVARFSARLGSCGFIMVFDAILTGRQSGKKLQCLCGNPIAKNFFQNWLFHNLWIKALKY